MILPRPRGLTTRQRAERAWRALKGSSRHLAMAGGGLVALVVAAISLSTVTVLVTGADGRFRGHCGLGYYLFGARQTAVESACRHAYTGHAVTFFLFVLVAAGLLAYAVVDLVRQVDRAAAANKIPSESVRTAA